MCHQMAMEREAELKKQQTQPQPQPQPTHQTNDGVSFGFLGFLNH